MKLEATLFTSMVIILNNHGRRATYALCDRSSTVWYIPKPVGRRAELRLHIWLIVFDALGSLFLGKCMSKTYANEAEASGSLILRR